MDLYRSIQYFAELGAFVSIYLLFKRERKPVLGYLAGAFSMFNRWTIANIADGKQDIIAIFFLVLAIYYLTSKNKKHKMISYLLYGISMGIKHIGIFMGPIFLMPLINNNFKFKDFIKSVLLFLIPTVGVGLIVIIDSPLAFLYSMLFSFTRQPSKPDVAFGYRELLVLYNVGVENNNIFFYLLPRLPLVLFTFLNTILLWLKKIPIYAYCLTSVFIFIAFNPVLISQYFTWVVPFIFFPILAKQKQ